MTTPLCELATIVRSKNAKPFILTIDLFFPDTQAMERALTSPQLTAARLAARYGVPVEGMRVQAYWPALAMKISMARRVPAGSFDDDDLLGAQQAALLLDLPI